MRIPRFSSASQMFVNLNVPTCQAVIRNLIYRVICRLEKSCNRTVIRLIDSRRSDILRYTSPLWSHWLSQLFTLDAM